MSMTRHLISAACGLLAFGCFSTALSATTPAGQVVNNQAQMTAVVDGKTVNKTSANAPFVVDEIIDLSLTWQDGSSVLTQPGAPASLLTYLLTNTGTGTESFTLSVDNSIPGNDFDPGSHTIYLDSNGNGTYDSGIDLAYDPATNLPTLVAGEDIVIFVANAIPVTALDTQSADSKLTATATSGSGAPGTGFPAVPPSATDSILGGSGGEASATGSHLISQTNVVLKKSAVVVNPGENDEARSGATITYTILVEVSGSGTATGLVVTDPIPQHTTYVDESMVLIDAGVSTALTDTNDADEGTLVEDPLASGNFRVEFSLGDLNNTNRTVTFQVTID